MSLAVDVRDLLHLPGASRPVRVREPLPGLHTGLAHVPPGVPLDADLLLESVVEGVLVSGPVSGTMRMDCARCLKPIDAAFRVEVRELYAPGATVDDDEYPLSDETVDLEPLIRDAVVLSMPFSPLCRPDCLGLCPRCGGDRNREECSCGPEVDERWAALSALDLPDQLGPTSDDD